MKEPHPEEHASLSCTESVSYTHLDVYKRQIINFANPDMVGHTGVEAAAVKAIEAVDECCLLYTSRCV